MIRRRVHMSRALTPALFLIVVASFFLPFLTVSQERVAKATGIELVRGEPRFSGHYVHDAYVGEVERRMRRGRPPATIAFVAAAIGLLTSWSANATLRVTAFAASVLGFLAIGALLQVTSSPFNDIDRHEGTWLSLVLLLAAIVVTAVRAFTRAPSREEDFDDRFPWIVRER